MKKINVCFHIGNISNCGGTEKVTTMISNMLLENYNYYNVFILSSYYNIEMGPFFPGNKMIKYDRIYNKNIPLRLIKFFTIKKIKKYVLDNNIDILIGVDTILSIYDIPAIKNTNCKFVAWEHFNYNYNLGVKLRDKARIYASLYSDALVVLSDRDRKLFEKNLTIKCPLLRIYNPFEKISNDTKYNFNSNIILSSGRLTYQKGFDNLIEVARLLKNKTENFKWIILGEGEDREMLQSKIDEYKLNDFVILEGRVKDVSSYYKKCKFFVSTSRFEGFALVLLEAKNFKLPIISFDYDCGPDEIVRNNVNGYIVNNNEEMCDKIFELLKDDEKCKSFSYNSQIDFENFSPDKIIKQWDNLFKKVIK